MSRWLITGAGGMLGRDLVSLLRLRGEAVTGPRHGDLEMTDAGAVLASLQRHRPDVVVNCAAWTPLGRLTPTFSQSLADGTPAGATT